MKIESEHNGIKYGHKYFFWNENENIGNEDYFLGYTKFDIDGNITGYPFICVGDSYSHVKPILLDDNKSHIIRKLQEINKELSNEIKGEIEKRGITQSNCDVLHLSMRYLEGMEKLDSASEAKEIYETMGAEVKKCEDRRYYLNYWRGINE